MIKEKNLKIVLVGLLSVVIMFALSNYNIVRADDADGIWGTSTESTSTSDNTNTGSTTPSNTNTENTSTTGNTNTDDDWGTIDDDFENAITENTQTNNATNNSSNNTANNTNSTFNVSNNTANNNASTTSNSNSLAKTGIEDSKGTVAVILVVCGIVAIYSFKKVREYNNM